jgi:UDP-N-acetyl-D-mannosaminuronate dehydrogenase
MGWHRAGLAAAGSVVTFLPRVGGDLRDAIRCASTKPFGFQAFHPGRESPVRVVGWKLVSRGAVLTYHDPFVADWRLNGEPVRRAADLNAEVVSADLVILLQDHSAYDLDRISRDARLVLDTRGRTEGAHIEVL